MGLEGTYSRHDCEKGSSLYVNKHHHPTLLPPTPPYLPTPSHRLSPYPYLPQIATATRRDNPSREHQPPLPPDPPPTQPPRDLRTQPPTQHTRQPPTTAPPPRKPIPQQRSARVLTATWTQGPRRGVLALQGGWSATCMYRAVLYLLAGGS